MWDAVNPPSLPEPRGFAHGMLSLEGGRLLLVAGQTAAVGDRATGDFAAQFAAALDRVLVVVRAVGGGPEHVGRLTVYVTDLARYRACRRELGTVWRERFGTHYPAMALVEVKALLDEGTLVEMEATAVVP
ncbi:MAG: RidA family protein [Candidatus Eiseniibacteriota bacterium]